VCIGGEYNAGDAGYPSFLKKSGNEIATHHGRVKTAVAGLP
jgi:hypothetical protein